MIVEPGVKNRDTRGQIHTKVVYLSALKQSWKTALQQAHRHIAPPHSVATSQAEVDSSEMPIQAIRPSSLWEQDEQDIHRAQYIIVIQDDAEEDTRSRSGSSSKRDSPNVLYRLHADQEEDSRLNYESTLQPDLVGDDRRMSVSRWNLRYLYSMDEEQSAGAQLDSVPSLSTWNLDFLYKHDVVTDTPIPNWYQSYLNESPFDDSSADETDDLDETDHEVRENDIVPCSEDEQEGADQPDCVGTHIDNTLASLSPRSRLTRLRRHHRRLARATQLLFATI